MRLGIKIKGEFLHLDTDTALPLDMQSPLYFGDRDPDIIPSAFTYNFSIPGAENSHNRRLLNRPEVLDNFDSFIINEPVEVYYDGDVMLTGILNVKTAPSTGRYSINILSGAAGNLNDFKTRKLEDIDYEGDRDFGPAESNMISHANAVVLAPDDYDYVFATVRVNFNELAEAKYINNYYLDTFFRDGADGDGAQYSTLVPFPRVTYLMDRIFLDKDYSTDSFLKLDDELNNLVLFNNYSLDKVNTSADPLTYADLVLDTKINLKNHVPDITINKFLKDALIPFGGVLLLEPLTKKARITTYKEILKKSDIADWTTKATQYYEIEGQEDLPDGLAYEHTSDDEYSLPFTSINRNNVLAAVEKLADLTNGDFIGALRLVEAFNVYYRSLTVSPSAPIWILHFREFLSVGDSPITLSSDTVQMYPASGNSPAPYDTSPNRLIPYFVNEYISPINADAKKIKNTILMFWRGLDEDYNANEKYPFCSNNVYNRDQSKVFNYSLLINTTSGLYYAWWKDWLTLLSIAKPVNFTMNLTSSDLRNFDFSKKYRIGQHLYYIKRIKTTLGTTAIKPSSIEALKIT